MIFKSAIQAIVARNLKNKLLKNQITEADLTPILKEIRTSFLDADVNLKVIRQFLDNVKTEVLNQQQLNANTKLDEFLLSTIRQNLINILGRNTIGLETQKRPLKIMMVGLNGSGKTTTTGKLAYYLKTRHNKKVANIGLDIYRPAAIQQLRTLSKEIEVSFFEKGFQNPVLTAKEILDNPENKKLDAFIFDTAGRLQTDADLMKELVSLKRIIEPQEILFVVDAMAGQDILEVAKEFHRQLKLTGIIITKTDSDARMGAALSIVAVLNIPIKFLGSGERYQHLNQFHPERIADRIMGMGDLVSLAEKAHEATDEAISKKGIYRMFSGQFDLEDLMQQMGQIKKIGSISSILDMMPTNVNISKNKIGDIEEKMRKWEIIMNSMTVKERRNPKLFKKDASRKTRVIKGSGCRPDDLNKLLKQWDESKKKVDLFVKSLKKGQNPFGKLPF
ncbi:signal recognition particle subunit SRP54 [Mycoplasmoides fastidiosum]|uniref:signal-recognition-particle GTPase n=1 Tax=Mycoplasmoides fastidiosum TaxID=92758 RepID=A0ABU0LZL7_9BACT|nr:signal recognition particle protein [Mycoplasmoides fastidiosum]MDQ0514150.1 signal recognition particle subunit SRP54 [Mycoplasmoides fastidiosum]UUD37442.1 signal recognition particle protein [Mycoplasmoides fastidiosum]